MLLPSDGTALAGTTIEVTETDDELNSDGDCSLREAIQAANLNTSVDGCPAGLAGGAPDAVLLGASTYTLSIAGADENANATGDLDLLDSVTIDGTSAASTIVQAGTEGAGIDRVFHISSTLTAAFSDLTIRNGRLNGAVGSNNGAGISMDSGGVLSLDRVTVSGNHASGAGGGLRVNATATILNSTVTANSAGSAGGLQKVGSGQLTITDSTISSNRASASGSGGGISLSGSGRATISGTTIENNFAGTYGGGIDKESSSTPAVLALAGSTVRNNEAGASWGGAGIRNADGSLIIDTSSFSNNVTGGSGGAVLNSPAPSKTASLTITRSTIGPGNSAGARGGGIENNGAGSISASLIYNNVVDRSPSSALGGGVSNSDGGNLTIDVSTVSGNSATGAGGQGGGLHNIGTLSIDSSTIAANSSTGDDPNMAPSGGNIRSIIGTATIENTIVGDSQAGGECSGSLSSDGFNIVEHVPSGCHYPGGAFGDLPSQDPGLEPLGAYGGPTLTHALKRSSPAIDRGSEYECPSTDQRGYKRPAYGGGESRYHGCDVGAHEARFLEGPLGAGPIAEEGVDDEIVFTFFLSGAVPEPSYATVRVSGRWATEGVDYTCGPDGCVEELLVPANARTVQYPVTIIDDSKYEWGGEGIEATLEAPTSGHFLISQTTTHGSIMDSADYRIRTVVAERHASFGLSKHLKARGRLKIATSTMRTCFRYEHVHIQKKKSGVWKTIETQTTEWDGTYEVKLPDRRGTYRALAPRSTEMKEELTKIVCKRVVSDPQTHEH